MFPSSIASHRPEEIRDELLRLMKIGDRFQAFTFSCLEIDTKLDRDLIFAFCETFRQCADRWQRLDGATVGATANGLVAKPTV